MANLQLKNNAYSALAAGIGTGDTSITVTTGQGDRFPAVGSGTYFKLTLQDASNNIEVIKVTARTSGADSMTVTRAQEGTTARSWSLGDAVELRVTSGILAPLALLDEAATIADFRAAINVPARTGSTLIGDSDSDTMTVESTSTFNGPTTISAALTATTAGNKITVSGTGSTFTVAPATAGTLNNVSIGGTTAAAGAFTSLSVKDGSSALLKLLPSGGTTQLVSRNSADSAYVSAIYDATQHIFQYSGVEAFRLTTSGMAGFGTSSPDLFSRGYTRTVGVTSSGSTSLSINSASGNGAYLDLGVNGVYSGGISTDGAGVNVSAIGAIPLYLSTNSNVRVTVDSSGQFGLDSTPETWFASRRVMRVGYGSAFVGYIGSSGTEVWTNCYLNASGNATYVANGAATRSYTTGGAHVWEYAASGTAGATATLIEAGRFSNAGNFLVGLASDASNSKAVVSADINNQVLYVVNENTTCSGAVGGVYVNYTNAAPNSSAFDFFRGTDSTATRVRIYSNGDIYNSNGTYGTISDPKVKNIIGSKGSTWDKTKAYNWIEYYLKSDVNQENKMLGLNAAEALIVSPGVISYSDDTQPVTKTRTVTKTVPVTVTEQQEQTKTETQFIDGAWREITTTQTVDVQVPVYDEFPLVDANGDPVMELVSPAVDAVLDADGNEIEPAVDAVYAQKVHKVARTEEVTETEEYTQNEPTGEQTMAVKYSIVSMLYHRTVQEAQHRIEALEVANADLLSRVLALESA